MLIISGRIKVHILRKICQFLTLFLLTDVKKRRIKLIKAGSKNTQITGLQKLRYLNIQKASL